MNELKITVEYKDKIFTYQNGYEAHIFDMGIWNDIDLEYGIEELEKYVQVVKNAYLEDSCDYSLDSIAQRIAEFWEEVRDLSTYAILEKIYRG